MRPCLVGMVFLWVSQASVLHLSGKYCGAACPAEEPTPLRGLQECTLNRGEGQQQDGRPNIVIIMADDLGYSDLGCYGGEILTPNLDRLAERGLRCSRFTNTSRCCPSRASLLTGKFQHRVGMGWMTAVDEHREGYRGQLDRSEPTIAELLQSAGYQTRMSGKWHLTVDTNFKGPNVEPPNGSWPTQRGFEQYYGGLSGGGGYFQPDWLAEDLVRIEKDALPADYYYTTEITNRACKFIRESDPTRPLFLYVAHYAPHRPLQAPEARIEACRPRYEVGYDVLRQQRLERLQRLGLCREDIPLGDVGRRLPSETPSWEELSTAQQRRWIDEMATYAAMVEIMDDGIGEIVSELESRGQLDNTLILFLSDNGATFEGGLISQLGADLSNTPFRNYKQFTHLGGVASPLIAHWPRRLTQFGELCDSTGHIIDLLPTCLDVAGITYPNEFNGAGTTPPDGMSLLPVFAGETAPERTLFWEHQSSRAVQRGNWRLVALHASSEWELYDLASDPYEQVDLADDQPALVTELSTRWQQWADTNRVLPFETRPWSERIRYYQDN